MKRLNVLILVIVVMTMTSGCQAGYDAGKIKDIAAQTQSLSEQLDTAQAALVPLVEQATANNVLGDESAAKVIQINDQVDKVQAQLNTVTTALSKLETTGDNLTDTVNAAATVNNATAGWNPYYTYIGFGLTIFSLVAGWIRKNNAAKEIKLQYDKAKAAVEEIVSGIEAMKKSITVEPSANVIQIIKESLSSAQTVDATKIIISDVKQAIATDVTQTLKTSLASAESIGTQKMVSDVKKTIAA